LFLLALLLSSNILAPVAFAGGSSLPPQKAGSAMPPSIPDSYFHALPHRRFQPGNAVMRKLTFSNDPSDFEISQSRLFLEPLLPMNSNLNKEENKELASALLKFKKRTGSEDLSSLNKFIASHHDSRWRASLEANMGELYFENGYLTDALKYWESAWEQSKHLRAREQKSTADFAISHLVELEARLGFTDKLEKHLDDIKGRAFAGSSEARVKSASDGLWAQRNHPEESYRCGPFGLQSIAPLLNPTRADQLRKEFKKAKSSKQGTNLAQLFDWSQKAGLKMQMAKRSPGATFISPSIMHWTVGHFTAIMGERDGKYQIQDPTFDSASIRSISPEALAAQTDENFLVPDGPLPAGWSPLSRADAEKVWGKGAACCRNGGKGKGCPSTAPQGGPSCGMPVAYAFDMTSSLHIVDTPLSSNPPIGPSASIQLTYNDQEGKQPGIFGFTNLGPDWSINWVSYLTLDGSSNITVNMPGGGYEVYSKQSNGPTPYIPDIISQAQMVVLGGGGYQRLLPDGSTQNFTLNDGSYWLMTSAADPQGNAVTINWDAVNFRVNSITDASGNTSTFSYVGSTPGTNAYYKLASVTDTWGRTALLSYDSTTTFLTSITDAASNVSSFLYDPSSNFINMMKTPYGSTSFYSYTPVGNSPTYPPVGLRFTFPDGSNAVFENWIAGAKRTYYWDREATAAYPNDPANLNYQHCKSTCFVYENWSGNESAVPLWTRRALEAPVVFSYVNQSGQDFGRQNTTNQPTQIGRQLTGFRMTATIGGTVTIGDHLAIALNGDSYMNDNGFENLSYTVQSGDTLQKIATQFANLVNSDFYLQAYGITATSNGAVVTVTSNGAQRVQLQNNSTGLPTETITCANGTSGPNPVEMLFLGNTPTPGQTLTLTVTDSGLPGGSESVAYTEQTGDTLTSICQGLAALVNTDGNLQKLGVTAYWANNYPNQSITSPIAFFNSNSPNTTTYSYTLSGGPLGVTLSPTPNGLVQQWTYQRNILGKMTQSIDPVGRQFNYNYALNNIDLLSAYETQGPSPANDLSLLGFWQYGATPHMPISYIDSSGQKTQYTYNGFGELATVTDANNNTSTFSYDGNGYLTQVQGPLSGNLDVSTFTFYGYGPVHTVTDSEGYTLSFSYDNLNRLTNLSYPDGTSETTVYDKLDAVLHSDRLGRWSKRAYDSLDQLAYEIDPLGRQTKYCWCSCGSLASITDGDNQSTSWHHDLQGRVIQKVFADSSVVNYSYGSNAGLLASKKDPLGQTTSFNYNVDNAPLLKYYSGAINPTSAVQTAYDQNFSRVTGITNGWGANTYAYGNSYNMVTLTGSPSTNDYINIPIYNASLAGGKYNFQYQVLNTDTTLSILAGSVKSAINANATLSAAGISATNSGATVTLSGTGSVTAASNTNGVTTETLTGTISVGDQVSITIYNPVFGASPNIDSYTVQSGDTLTTVATALKNWINSNLTGNGITATSSGAAVVITSTSPYQTTYVPAGGPTSTMTQTGGPSEFALATVPGDAGNRLSSVSNNVISNSQATYSYDNLGRTTNRSINGVSNSTTWSYDALSRLSSEVNPLGTFNYAYLDDAVTPITIGGTASGGRTETITINGHTATYVTTVSDTLSSIASNLASQINALAVTGISASALGTVISASTPVGASITDTTQGAITISIGSAASKGSSRLSSISYPNGQTTNFTYLPNIADQRLQGIANLSSTPATISQFNYAYDAAGQLKQWLQNQNSTETHFSLGYDLASQLSASTSDSGSTINAYISGTVHAGDLITITAYDALLTGTTPKGQETASYTVQVGDTASSIASSLVHNGSSTGINDVMGSNLGISASSSGAVITISQSSATPTFCTQFTCAVSGVGATDTIALGASSPKANLHKQLYYNYDCAGNRTGVQGDSTGTLPSLTTTATQYSYNNLNQLVGTSAGGPIRFQGTYANPVKSAVVNVSQTMTITGGITNGDVLTLTVNDNSNSTGKNFSYTVNSSVDTTTTLIATHFVSTNSTALSAIGISASSSANVVTLTSSSVNVTSYSVSKSTGATEQLALGSSAGAAGSIIPSNTFTANPVLAGGASSTANTASVTARSGGGTAGTNNYTITVNSATPANLTYDGNGNMACDGTNGYNFDAENRLVRITYPYGAASTSANVTVGTTPVSCTYSLDGSKLYVLNSGSGTVSVINTSSNTVSSTITVGTSPSSMTLSPDGSLLYVANNGSGNVSVISTASNTVIHTITVGTNPQAVAFNPTGAVAFVTNSGSASVSVINTLTSSVSTTVSVGTTPYALAVTPDGTEVYVLNKGAGTVSVINTIDNTVLSTVTVGTTPFALAITPTGTEVLVVNQGSGTISVISTQSDTVTNTITVGSAPYAVAITPDGTKAYVTNKTSGTVSVINISSNSVAATITVGTSPEGINLTVDGLQAYVANSGAGTVSVINTIPNTVASTLTVTTTPISSAFSPDGTHAFVADSGAAKVTPVSTSANNSQFVYDGLGRNVSITEIVSGSATTLQFVWCGNERCESRNGVGGGTIVSRFFPMGETISAANYFYNKDHLGSIRELDDNTSAVKTRYSYDPYGQVTQTFVTGSLAADFQYAGYYHHAASGLCLTRTRAYSPNTGRWLSRDPIGEDAGTNLYGYVGNNPISFVDPSGLDGTVITQVMQYVGPTITAVDVAVGGTAAIGVAGIGGAIYGTYDIGTRGLPEISRSWGTLTGPEGWLGPNGIGALAIGSGSHGGRGGAGGWKRPGGGGSCPNRGRPSPNRPGGRPDKPFAHPNQRSSGDNGPLGEPPGRVVGNDEGMGGYGNHAGPDNDPANISDPNDPFYGIGHDEGLKQYLDWLFDQ
jgi:RHS repeat-associated protein